MANKKVERKPMVWSVAALVLLLSAGCVQLKEIYQQNVARWRKPGLVLVESPEKTMRRYCCGKPSGNFLVLEVAEALPERALPGEEINHHIRYALLPTVTSAVKGRLIRKVTHNGRAVFEDVTECRFVPGTWNVDAFIRIPRSAPPGLYAIEVELKYGKKSIRRASSFLVKQG